MKTLTISDSAFNEVIEALVQACEYFDNRADCDGDSEGFIPNEEMKLQMMCDEALKTLSYTHEP